MKRLEIYPRTDTDYHTGNLRLAVDRTGRCIVEVEVALPKGESWNATLRTGWIPARLEDVAGYRVVDTPPSPPLTSPSPAEAEARLPAPQT